MEIALPELKFLLQLLSCPHYRGSLSQLTPNPKSTSAERDKVFEQLRDRGFVDGSDEIVSLKLAPAGKALLNLGLEDSALSDHELKILHASETGTTPGQIRLSPAAEKIRLIRSLAERGFLHLETRVKEVWLTDAGKTYLRSEYSPRGTGSISLTQLNHYLQFLRQTAPSTSTKEARPSDTDAVAHVSDSEILQMIQALDHELGTKNYLPLFHLRHQLRSLSRDQVDQALFRLQRQDYIELSSVQDASGYTPEQVAAGIPQDIGGPLFFISVV